MTTTVSRAHVDLHEARSAPARGYHRPCAVYGRSPSAVRVLEWYPPRGPKGVPAWSVRASYYCSEHRAEAERAARAATGA